MSRIKTPILSGLTVPYRNEVLDLYLFRGLHKVREVTYWWMIDYDEHRPHGSLGDMTQAEYKEHNAENSTLQLDT